MLQILHTSHSHDPRQGILLKLVSVFLFGLMALQIKLLTHSYPTSEIVFSRSFFAIFPLLPMVLAAGGWSALRVKSWRGQSTRNIVGLIAMVFTFYALPQVPLATFTAILFTMPLFVVVLAALFLNEKLSGARLGAVITGFIGVLIILRPAASGYDYFSLMALLSAFFVAIVTVILRRLTATENSISIVFWFTLFCGVGSGAVLLFEFKLPDLHDGLLLAGSGLAGGVAQVLLTHAYRFGQVSLLTAFEYTGIIWATGFELLFWHNLPDFPVFIGAAIIILSGLYLLRHATRAVRRADLSSAEGKPC